MPRFSDEDEFLEWKHHPLTEMWLQYLKDYRMQLAQLWASGEPLGPEVQATATTLTDMIEMDYEGIREFYRKEDEEDEDHSATRQGSGEA